MRKIVLIICIAVIAFFVRRGFSLYGKYREAKKLKIDVAKFKLHNLSTKIDSTIQLRVNSFARIPFTVNQINIDVLTQNNEILARQSTPLKSTYTLHPNRTNMLPVSFTINSSVIISEVKRLGGIPSIVANFLTSGKYGLPIKLEGFIVLDNITININETLTV